MTISTPPCLLIPSTSPHWVPSHKIVIFLLNIPHILRFLHSWWQAVPLVNNLTTEEVFPHVTSRVWFQEDQSHSLNDLALVRHTQRTPCCSMAFINSRKPRFWINIVEAGALFNQIFRILYVTEWSYLNIALQTTNQNIYATKLPSNYQPLENQI